jgi:hypothetical protein
MAELLAPDGIAVHCMAKLPGVDAALAGLDQMLVGRDPERGPRPRAASPETWAGWGLPTDEIGRLFTAGAAYYRAAPWSNITNEDIVRAKVRGGGSWSASVMGAINTPGGGITARDMEDLIALLDAIPSFAREHEPMLSGLTAQKYPIRWRPREGAVSIVFEGAEGRFG